MTDTKDAIKELIETGKRFFVASNPSNDEPSLFAASALKKILEHAGKETFFWPPVSEELAEKYKPLLSVSSYPPLPRKIKIRIPKTVELEEMRYDDEPDAVSIVISPKSHLDIKDLLIERVPYEMDGAFCFFSDEATFEKIEAPVARPSREKIIFFSRQNFAEQNVVGQARNNRTLAEKIYDIHESIAAIPAPDTSALNVETATLILASLFAETNGLTAASSAMPYHLAGLLMEQGADVSAVRLLLNRPSIITETQLLGRALARTTLDAPLQASWTFLATSDFEKTHCSPTPAFLAALLKKIFSAIERPLFSILCYEQDGIHAVIASADRARLGAIARRTGAHAQDTSDFLFIEPVFPTFSEAETKIRQLLKEGPNATISL